MGRVKYCKWYVIASGQRNNTKAFARLPASLLDRNFHDFSRSKLYQRPSKDIALPSCCMLWKQLTIFSRNLSCQSSYFQWISIYLFFSRSFQSENKKTAEIRAGSLSHLMTLPLDSTFVAMLCMLVLKCKPAGKLNVKKFENSNYF